MWCLHGNYPPDSPELGPELCPVSVAASVDVSVVGSEQTLLRTVVVSDGTSEVQTSSALIYS